ncbi:MAG TPA: hypothetical protein EYG18_05750 [Micavibrio sp.]|jgi:hypothetical protein|nr:hypothetical protein [Micavibrio sp.]
MPNTKKEFLRDCALYIQGELPEVKIRGKLSDVKLFASALKESRGLYESLNNDAPSMREVVSKIEQKRQATHKLKERTGFIWPF